MENYNYSKNNNHSNRVYSSLVPQGLLSNKRDGTSRGDGELAQSYKSELKNFYYLSFFPPSAILAF